MIEAKVKNSKLHNHIKSNIKDYVEYCQKNKKVIISHTTACEFMCETGEIENEDQYCSELDHASSIKQ